MDSGLYLGMNNTGELYGSVSRILRAFFSTQNYPQWLLFLFKPSRWHICFIILTTSLCVINLAWIISITCFLFLRRNSQQNVSSVSSLRRTGTTHTLLISTSMGREERDISWLSTRTARHVMAQNLGDIKKFTHFLPRPVDPEKSSRTLQRSAWTQLRPSAPVKVREGCLVSSLHEVEMLKLRHSVQSWVVLWKCTG